jgi:putative copper resistance protein D
VLPFHLVADEVLPPLTGSRLLTTWELDPWVLAGLLVAAGLYVAGVVRLRRKGVAWPVGRTLAFVVGGLGTIAIATLSAVGAYDDTLFTDHMVQHMVLAMVSPVFLALGAPITLVLRAANKPVRHAVVAIVHSRVARFVSAPPIAWAHFVALPFVLYNTGWYEATLRNATLHEWLHVQFLAAGCLFFWPLLGLDPMPRRLGYPARILMVFLTLPAHAILGLSIMIQRHVIAFDYYAALHRTWGPTLQADQNAGGGLLWASGDLVGLLFFGVLFFQWQRADDRKARRDDRRLAREQAGAAWRVVPQPAPQPAAGERAVPAVAAVGDVADEPMLVRPWWEVDPGPLADRIRRERWERSDSGLPDG